MSAIRFDLDGMQGMSVVSIINHSGFGPSPAAVMSILYIASMLIRAVE
jgi:hypothetical protein